MNRQEMVAERISEDADGELETLFTADPTCSECKKPILSIEDAHVFEASTRVLSGKLLLHTEPCLANVFFRLPAGGRFGGRRVGPRHF